MLSLLLYNNIINKIEVHLLVFYSIRKWASIVVILTYEAILHEQLPVWVGYGLGGPPRPAQLRAGPH
jgi:hypothetical protein